MLRKLIFVFVIFFSLFTGKNLFSQTNTFTYKIKIDNVVNETDAKLVKDDLLNIIGNAKVTFNNEDKTIVVVSIHKYDLVELRNKLIGNNFLISEKIELIE